MPVYVALFRAVNVSGHNIIKMEHLRKLMTANGYKNVETYIQSGNVVFETDEINKAKIAHDIKLLLYKEYGYDVVVFLYDEADLTKAIDNNPYTDKTPEPSGPKKYFVVFLSDEPTIAGIDKVNKYNRSDDVFKIIDKVMYMKLSQSAADSKLTNSFIENKFNNCKTTTRNWNTTLKMLIMIQSRKA
ncbi:MAG: hypothetical protein BM557_11475 [Flavobacterium sp. MedPE-SWcel]|uniref:DUF1697 domain-containing protein n=1 Tax=uncultured Flavobacterium sp. TaxID=165435 RepID=UPI00092364E3|nr:DUF1697 domain-containing protein [uncultured Flavobacterium sp.]OIQ15381.1 MAG: hypothetical protein BM557_11475 [Flavobacterium sp. MedPE-SWcel]